MALDLDAYGDRIGLASLPAIGEDGLREVHAAQFFSIPFENLDIQLGRGIRLDPESLVEKLVHRSRGGYCFELNGLLLMALRELGFEARPLLARVHLGPTPSPRTHQLSLVTLGERPWIVDAGFGAGGPRCPIPLEVGRVERGMYRLERREPWGTLLQTLEDGTWKDSYSFDLSHVAPADIELGNHFTSTSPRSHFVTSRVAGLPTDRGRVSLRDFTVTTVTEEGAATREIPPGPPYLKALRDLFGIELDAAYEDFR